MPIFRLGYIWLGRQIASYTTVKSWTTSYRVFFVVIISESLIKERPSPFQQAEEQQCSMNKCGVKSNLVRDTYRVRLQHCFSSNFSCLVEGFRDDVDQKPPCIDGSTHATPCQIRFCSICSLSGAFLLRWRKLSLVPPANHLLFSHRLVTSPATLNFQRAISVVG